VFPIVYWHIYGNG